MRRLVALAGLCAAGCAEDMFSSVSVEPTPVLEPNCAVERHGLPTGGVTGPTPVPRCDAQGELPDGVDECWHPRVDDNREDDLDTHDDISEECSHEGWNLEIGLRWRDFDSVPGGSSYSATCVASEQPHVDCPQLP